MLSGRRKKDYAAESAADALEAQAEAMGVAQVAGSENGNVIAGDAGSNGYAADDEGDTFIESPEYETATA